MDLLEQKLSRIDLNLLISLSVLLKEKSVSRAADRLYLSQSAMSRTLQRLRDVFGDSLFHRSPAGIIPTEKAEYLETLLPALLQGLDDIFSQQDFTPENCDKHFSLSLPSLMSHALFLPLVQEVSRLAPSVRLTEYPAQASPYKKLESGFLDFCIHIEKANNTNFTSTPLAYVRPAIFARIGHPLENQENVSLKDCIEYLFLDLNIQGEEHSGFTNPIDAIFFNQGFTRNIKLKSSQFSILTAVLKSTDSLLVASSSLLDLTELDRDFVKVFEFESDDKNSIEMFLLEHKRTENSLAHKWLKEKIIKQCLLFSK